MAITLAQMGANLPVLPTGPTVNVAGLVKPNIVTGDNMQASLIDLGQVQNMFNPDAGIIGQFDASQGIVNTQIGGAKTESGRMRDVSNEATKQITPMAQDIYGRLSQNMGSSTGAAAQAAQNVLGQNFGDVAATQLAHFQTASDLGRSGFEAQAPLLQAGFNELHNRRGAALDQLNAQLSQEILGQRTGYLTGLEQRRQGALSEAAAFNTQAINQASEYNAAAAARRAAAEEARREAERDRAFRAQEAARQRAHDAAEGARNRAAAAAARAQEKADEKGPWEGNWQADAKFYKAGPQERSLERGASLVAIEGDLGKAKGKLHPNARKWYDDKVKSLRGKAPEEIQAALAKDGTAGKYPQAASLLMFDTIGPSAIDPALLYQGAVPGQVGAGVYNAPAAPPKPKNVGTPTPTTRSQHKPGMNVWDYKPRMPR